MPDFVWCAEPVLPFWMQQCSVQFFKHGSHTGCWFVVLHGPSCSTPLDFIYGVDAAYRAGVPNRTGVLQEGSHSNCMLLLFVLWFQMHRFHLTKPWVLFALLVNLAMCWSHRRSLEIFTLRYSSVVTLWGWWPSGGERTFSIFFPDGRFVQILLQLALVCFTSHITLADQVVSR